MKRLDSTLLKVFLYGLPVVVLLAVATYSYSLEDIEKASSPVRFIYNTAGLIFGVWMLLSIYLAIRLMFSASFREKVLVRLTLIKERDEREVLLTGQAIKTTFLTSLAILFFLFYLSCIQISIYRVPPEKAVDGKTGVVNLGFGLHFMENRAPANGNEATGNSDIFSYKGLPVSTTAVILGLILWQIISYNYLMRRLLKLPGEERTI